MCFSATLVRCLGARGQIEKCRDLAEATLCRALAHGLAVAADDVASAWQSSSCRSATAAQRAT